MKFQTLLKEEVGIEKFNSTFDVKNEEFLEICPTKYKWHLWIMENNKLADQSRTFTAPITGFLAKIRQNGCSDFLICTNFEDIIVDQIINM